MFPSRCFSASTAATSRVIFLDVDGVILPAGLNLSRFKIARRVERIEEGVWVLVPSWKHVYFMVNFMHNEGCKQSQKYAKVFSFTRELPFWSGIAEVRSTWLWWMVWRFRPKAMLGALWIWCLIRANLYNNLIYTYKYSGSCYGPPPKLEVIMK